MSGGEFRVQEFEDCGGLEALGTIRGQMLSSFEFGGQGSQLRSRAYGSRFGGRVRA